MSPETQLLLTALLILLISLLQFVLGTRPQGKRVCDLEERLAGMEAQLETILKRLHHL